MELLPPQLSTSGDTLQRQLEETIDHANPVGSIESQSPAYSPMDFIDGEHVDVHLRYTKLINRYSDDERRLLPHLELLRPHDKNTAAKFQRPYYTRAEVLAIADQPVSAQFEDLSTGLKQVFRSVQERNRSSISGVRSIRQIARNSMGQMRRYARHQRPRPVEYIPRHADGMCIIHAPIRAAELVAEHAAELERPISQKRVNAVAEDTLQLQPQVLTPYERAAERHAARRTAPASRPVVTVRQSDNETAVTPSTIQQSPVIYARYASRTRLSKARESIKTLRNVSMAVGAFAVLLGADSTARHGFFKR